ncbi:MAG: hypothetical protein JWN58_1506 [Gammaproteobacteria bacterium]|nr:hypothetical protein [Gammaproteobacteria bacterium]
MIFGWFDTREVDSLADELAQDFARRLPPAGLPDRMGNTTKKKDAQQSKTRESIFRKVRDYASKRRLNVFKKARLANRFKWALLAAGYPKSFVDDLAFELATLMATTKKTGS